MKPQNLVEGAVPMLLVIVTLAVSLLSPNVGFIIAVVSLIFVSLYLFVRKEW